ncbi:MAG: CotH kinase family protein [Reichenbachiella sp.]
MSCTDSVAPITPIDFDLISSSIISSSDFEGDSDVSSETVSSSSSVYTDHSSSSSTLSIQASVNNVSSSSAPELSSSETQYESSSSFTSSSSVLPVDPFPGECSEIYDQTIVPTFNVSIDQTSLNALLACNEAKVYYPAKFIWEGDTIDVMIRQKGNWSWKCEKKQFVISFNENSKGRFKGQRKIVLDAPWYDHSYLNERMSFSIMKDFGEYYSCTNHALLNINDQLYGLYSNIERLDKEYLERHFENPEGNLYESAEELKTNEEAPGDEININGFWNAQTPEAFSKVVNMQQVISQWAAQAFISDSDSWWAGYHINSYVYDIPDSTLVMLPYDMDMGMRFEVGTTSINDSYDTTITRDPIYHEHRNHKKEDLFKMVMRDSLWCEYFIESLEKHYLNWDVAKLENRYTTYVKQIKNHAHLDPYKFFTSNDFDLHVAQAQHFFRDRAIYIRQWIDRGNHCPAYQ